MSLKHALKSVAALAIAGAAIGSAFALTGATANAATERCGYYCETLTSQSLGAGHDLAVSGNGAVLMAPGFNAKEDFIAVPVGTVAELASAGDVPASLAATYAQEVVYELSYAPAGALTDYCVGVSAPTAGATVALQKCGAPVGQQPTPTWEGQKGTLWIGVYRDHVGNYEPFVNVAASAHAAVALQANAAGSALTINYMSISAGKVAADQLWESLIGVYGQAQAWPTPQGNEPAFTGR
jgi:hypothetical protein